MAIPSQKRRMLARWPREFHCVSFLLCKLSIDSITRLLACIEAYGDRRAAERCSCGAGK